MRSPLVTYIISAYNGAAFLEESVASVLGQTHPRIELIVVDDGSTDTTPEILQRLRDPRLRVLRQPNLGQEFAANRGFSLARGQYVAHVGQDDVLLPEKTGIQLRAMAEQNWDFCFSWTEIIDGLGRPLDHDVRRVYNQSTASPAEAIARLAKGNFLAESSGLIHRRCLEGLACNVGLFCVGDYYRWLHLFRRFSGGVIDQPLVRIRVHDGNISFDRRFPLPYRSFEEQASKALVVAECDTMRPGRFFWTSNHVRALRAQAEWVMTSGEPSLGLLAYVLASRSLSLSPFDPEGYRILSRILSWLGYEYPAALLAGRAERVAEVAPYPLPLVASPARRLYRGLRAMLVRLSGGRWSRIEARVLEMVAARLGGG